MALIKRGFQDFSPEELKQLELVLTKIGNTHPMSDDATGYVQRILQVSQPLSRPRDQHIGARNDRVEDKSQFVARELVAFGAQSGGLQNSNHDA